MGVFVAGTPIVLRPGGIVGRVRSASAHTLLAVSLSPALSERVHPAIAAPRTPLGTPRSVALWAQVTSLWGRWPSDWVYMSKI